MRGCWSWPKGAPTVILLVIPPRATPQDGTVSAGRHTGPDLGGRHWARRHRRLGSDYGSGGWPPFPRLLDPCPHLAPAIDRRLLTVRLANRPLTVGVGRLAVSRQPSLDARRTRWHWRWRVAR